MAKLQKKLWNLFGDSLGKTLFHPQFFLKSYEYQAVLELKKRAKGIMIDIGCGRQIYKKELVGQVKKYIGVDHPQVSKKYEDKEKPDVFADALDLPFSTNYCDTVSMISVLEHIPDPTRAIQEASRILKPNGIFVLITVQNYPLHDAPYDYFRYTRFSLKKLMENEGLKIVSLKPLGTYPIFAGQLFNVFLLNTIKKALSQNTFTLIVALLLTPFIFLLTTLSNFTSLFLSKLIPEDYTKGAFAIYNLAVAKKLPKSKTTSLTSKYNLAKSH